MASILIVDDEPTVASTLAFVFKLRQHSPVTAGNGASALTLLETMEFDAALVDVNMPGMDGFAVCRELRARTKATGRKLPVWMMTGAYCADYAERAVDAGAVCLLRKPFEIGPLVRMIESRLVRRAPVAAS